MPVNRYRRRWIVPVATLARAVDESDYTASLQLNRWRTEAGVPDQAFLLQTIHHVALPDRYKPQYVDFTSPLFTRILRSAVRECDGTLTFEEVLPSPASFPSDDNGETWAVELQLDALSAGILRVPRSPQTASVNPGHW